MAATTRLSQDVPYYAVVVDANTFITGAISSLPSSLLSSPLLTTDAVRAEVRDARAKHVLETLPFELKTRIPAETSIAAVKKFAAATGDLSKLSETDIEIIALTHQMEIEANGDKFIRTSPPSMETIAGLYHVPKVPPAAEADAKIPVACRFFNTAKGCREGEACRFIHEKASSGESTEAATSADGVASNDGAATAAGEAPAASLPAEGDDGEWETVPVKGKPKRGHHAPAKREPLMPSESKAEVVVPLAPVAVATTEVPVDSVGTPEEGEVVLDGEDDGEGEWITPLAPGETPDDSLPFGYEKLVSSTGVNDDEMLPPERKLVVCITSDFAMQNVILQMGLNLASPAGKLIRSTKQWVLKCDACFTIVTDMSKLFCPRCGNATLARLGVTLGADGTPRFHYKKNREFRLRGTNYALPKPKGGRDGDLLLREDQLLTGYWAQQAKKKVVKTSMFADRAIGDLDNASMGLTRVTRGEIVVGLGKRNPNEVRRKKR